MLANRYKCTSPKPSFMIISAFFTTTRSLDTFHDNSTFAFKTNLNY